MTPSRTSCSRQLTVLRWTASLGATSAEALAVVEGATIASARGHLAAAERRGLLRSHRPLGGQPALYAPTRAGLRAADLDDLDPVRVSPANAAHLLACCSAAAWLQRRYPDHRVVGEQRLRLGERGMSRPPTSARLGVPAGEPRMHRADLLLWPSSPAGLPIAVEVELTVKAPRRLREICRGWARCRGVAGVLYLAAPEAERALARAIESVAARERIVVIPLAVLEREPSAAPFAGAITSGA